MWVKNVHLNTQNIFLSVKIKKRRPRQLSWGQNRCHTLKLSPLWWIDCGMPSTPPVCPPTHPPTLIPRFPALKQKHTLLLLLYMLYNTHSVTGTGDAYCVILSTSFFFFCIRMREKKGKIFLVCRWLHFNWFLSVWWKDLSPKTLFGFWFYLVLR